MLLVQAEITVEADKVVWKGGHHIFALPNSAAPKTISEISEDPSILTKLREVAARNAARKSPDQIQSSRHNGSIGVRVKIFFVR
jgi:hypothetical protein